jgi:uncharacterized protein (UPF0332 family)
MSYARELLTLAEKLATQESDAPNQAELRRSVSTSYYALFHLLISEATANYAHASLRPELGRVFEHGRMKNAAVQRRAAMQNRSDDALAGRLHLVTGTFIEAQAKRMAADYHTGRSGAPRKLWRWRGRLARPSRRGMKFATKRRRRHS